MNRDVLLCALLVSGALGSAACGGDPTGESSAEVSGCGLGELEPGTSRIPIEHDGRAREYLLYVPAGYDDEAPRPLLLNFHGFTSNAGQQAFFSMMNETADEQGFVLAYPEGIGPAGGQSFNGGELCCGDAQAENVDDVGFALAIIEDLSARGCLDRKRIYATGMSNGGFMAHRLACDAADHFAAVASVTGALGLVPESTCQPSRAVPLIQFHGTEDPLVSYEASVVPAIEGWAIRNGCDPQPIETYARGDASCETYDGCDDGARVTLCTVEGGGHCWFGQSICPYGESTTEISANGVMWEFFSGYRLPD